MQTSKFIIALILAIAVLISQAGPVLAAPVLEDGTISGTVKGLTCKTDPITGIKNFLLTVELAGGISQTILIAQTTAESLGLIEFTADGSPDCSQEVLDTAIGMEVKVASPDVLLDEEPKHPVGDALATFFEEITDYETIMQAHDGELEELKFGKFGFGVLAQALWLTKKLVENSEDLVGSEVFIAILQAKKDGNYGDLLVFEDGSSPQSWGQFRKALLAAIEGEKKINPGFIMSIKDQGKSNNNGDNGNGQDPGNGNNPNKHGNSERGNPGKNEDKGNGKNK